MRVTQQSIAKLAGVSQATVSRVLSNDPRVEPAIRERVEGVIRQHNYSPDVRARSLRQKRSHLIGLVLRRASGSLHGDPFFAQLVSETVECLIGTQYQLCLDVATDSDNQRHVYDELLRTRRVDGLILVESETYDERITRLQEDSFPFVVIGNAFENPNLNVVDNDNVLAGRIATQHLVDQGYQRVAMLAGPKDLTVTRDRVSGYMEAIKAKGMKPRVIYSDFGIDGARSAALDVLYEQNAPDAILAMDDYMAAGVLQAARHLELRTPDQLGVAGFNNSPLSLLVDGGMTSVDLRIDSMIRWAIQRLIHLIEGNDEGGEHQRLMPCELHVRGSSVRGRVANLL